MRSKSLVLVALCLGVGLSAGVQAKTHAKAKATGDGEAVAMLEAADQAEVDTARQALGKKLDDKVSDYAKTLETDHSENLKQTRTLAAKARLHPAETAAVRDAKKKAMDTRNKLGKLSGDAYAKAYIDAMVEDHTEDLKTIDDKLVPEAKNADLVAHLKATREVVARHLAAAQSLQSTLK